MCYLENIENPNVVLFPPNQIHPHEEDYGFEIEEKNKAIVVKSVSQGSNAEVSVDVTVLRFLGRSNAGNR